MNTASFSIQDAIGFGWAMVKEKFWFLLGLFLISGLFSVVPDVVGNFTDNTATLLLVQAASFVFGFVVDAGLTYVMLRLYDGKSVQTLDVFSQYPITFRYFTANVLSYGAFATGLSGVVMSLLGYEYILANPVQTLGYTVGSPVLLLFGTYIVIRYQFCRYFILDKRMTVIESLKESSRITDGKRWYLFRFALVLLGINFLGVLVFIVGTFVTMPISMLATAYAYRKLSSPVTETEAIEKSSKDFLMSLENAPITPEEA